ncbi:MAG: DUF4062 domain-containing protein [Jatrophihabitantaceae bacterium]
MDLRNGWNLSEAVVRKIRLLDYLADNHSESRFTALPASAAQPGTEEHRLIVLDLEDFKSRGWLNLAQDFGGGADAMLHGPGWSEIEDIRAKRNDRVKRHQAARDAVLAWLHEEYVTGAGRPSIGHFSKSPFGLFYGSPFSDDEVSKATRWLRDQHLISGQGSSGGGIIRPSITSNGIRVAESGASVNGAGQFVVTGAEVATRGPQAAAEHVNAAELSPLPQMHNGSAWDQEMTKREAAELLGVSQSTVHRWVTEQLVPARQVSTSGKPRQVVVAKDVLTYGSSMTMPARVRDRARALLDGTFKPSHTEEASQEGMVATPEGTQPAGSLRRYQVFLSSTFTDLQAERLAVTEAVLATGRCFPAGMELFGASHLPPWKFIQRVLDQTDYMVLVIGDRYGSSPPEGDPSYTEREYDYAKSIDVPVIPFVAGRHRQVMESQIERDDTRREGMTKFREKIRAAHLVDEWDDPRDLAQKVVSSLWREITENPRPGWLRGNGVR